MKPSVDVPAAGSGPPPSTASRVPWRVRPPAPPAAVERLSATLRIHPQLAAVLWARGWRDGMADRLDPPLVLSAIPDLATAAARLVDAIERGRRVRIHGDYDADGISGTAVLTLGLRSLGARVTPFIPHRIRDGYGIHPDRLAEHAADTDLFVTVDCGIGNLDEIAALQAAGIEVIVTDHHMPGAAWPDCLIVHPKRSPSAAIGLPELTGAGVAYHLLWSVHAGLGLPAPVEYADLATIGTIADVAPLLGENRALVKLGLARLRESSWPGVRATLALARLSAAPTARDVAFGLAPRLNAAGRMGEADLGLELFTTASESRAREIAARLDEHNRERKRITDAMFDSALPMVDPDAPAIVVAHPDWHPGVMGLVASQLVERYFRPVYIVAGGKGSVRSTPGISAVGGLSAAAAHLTRWGGHAQAAGFALDMEHFGTFRDAICRYVAGHPTPQPTVVADALLGLDAIDADLFAAAAELEPYGEGHPPPGFLVGATVAAAKAVGHDGGHLQLRLATVDGRETKGVAFRQGAWAGSLAVGDPVDVAAVLTENAWNGRTTIEFQALAVRPGERVGVGDQLRPVDGGRGRVRRGSGDGRLVRIDPGAADPLEEVRGALREGERVRLVLTAADLTALENEANAWPTVTDVRAAWVARARGRPTPMAAPSAAPMASPSAAPMAAPMAAPRAAPRAAPLAARVDAALADLGLLDADGRVVKGRKVEPYASPRLRAGLVRRYALLTLAEAYRRLDDDGFEHALLALADLPPD